MRGLLHGRVAELADAWDLKSQAPLGACGFKSRLGYLFGCIVVNKLHGAVRVVVGFFQEAHFWCSVWSDPLSLPPPLLTWPLPLPLPPP